MEGRVDGHWVGELSPSALSTATAISALSFFLESSPDHPEIDQAKSQIQHGLNWLVRQQNDDGGFGDTSASYSNISTTMLVIAAIHASGSTKSFEKLLRLAQQYVEHQGGVEGIRKRYGDDKTFAVPILANCAMAGLVPWREVSALPFEAACVPQKFYHWLQLPVVSYAIPALVAIGQAKFINDPPWDPVRRCIRSWSIKKSLDVLQRMQPESGGYLEAVPLTSFVVMALATTKRANHPVVLKGIRFLLDSFREGVEGASGSWPIDTNLATWSTTLTINGLAGNPTQLGSLVASQPDEWKECLDWLLRCQYEIQHPFTGSPPGGWGWTDLTGSVPDADDTPGALLALRSFYDLPEFANDRTRILSAAENGIHWLLKLQNRDLGWPTFCRGWGRLPFDRSGSDLTAHVIRSFVAWQDQVDQFTLVRRRTFERAMANGFRYLEKTQREDGSWLPLWFGNQDMPDDINPFYGTAKVVVAYRDAKRLDTHPAKFGLNWIVQNQNPDGGWGGGPSVQWTNDSLGNSSVEETALCTEALLGVDEDDCKTAAWRGIRWLIQANESNVIDQFSPIGFYFAKLWYYEKSYPLVFSAAALSSALRQKQLTENQLEENN